MTARRRRTVSQELVLAIPHEDSRNLGSGGIALRRQSSLIHTIDQTNRNSPVHGFNSPITDLVGISEISQSVFGHSLSLGEAVQYGSNVLSGDVGTGSEGSVRDTLNDLGIVSPDDGIGVPGVLSNISEGMDMPSTEGVPAMRYRTVTSSARVRLALGAKMPSPLPFIRPFRRT